MRIYHVPLRRVLIPLAVLTALLLAGWYFIQPLPFPDLNSYARVETVCVELMPGSISQESAPLSAGSPPYEQVRALLARSSYHRCPDTLLGANSTGSTGRHVVQIYGYSRTGELELDLTVTSGAHILRDGLAYRLGWWGTGAGQGLTEDLTQALGPLSL